MQRLTSVLAAVLLTACTTASEGPSSVGTQASAPAAKAITGTTNQTFIVADAVKWPNTLRFCPVSADNTFDQNCSRSVQIPKEAGASGIGDVIFMGRDTIGQFKDLNRGPRPGEVYVVHPSVAPSGRYALVEARDNGAGSFGRRLNIKNSTIIIEARPNLVTVMPNSASSGRFYGEEEVSSAEALEAVRRMLPKDGFDYELAQGAQISCKMVGQIFTSSRQALCTISE